MKHLWENNKPNTIFIVFFLCALIALGEHSLKIGSISAAKFMIHWLATTVVFAGLFITLKKSVVISFLFFLLLTFDLFSRLSYDAAMTITVWMSLITTPVPDIFPSIIDNFLIIVVCLIPIIGVFNIPAPKTSKTTNRFLGIFAISYILLPSLFSYPHLFETNGYKTHKQQSHAMRTPEAIIDIEHVVIDIAWRFPVLESIVGIFHTANHFSSLIPPLQSQKWTQVQQDNNAPNLMVLVIGESLRADHMQLYGYDKVTNPNLSALKNTLKVYPNAYSAGSNTWSSLPNILALQAEEFDSDLSIVTLAQSAGYKVHWLSNQRPYETYGITVTKIAMQADVKKFISQDAASQQLDGEILPYFDSLLKKRHAESKDLIIIHLYGSHLTFSDRYPEEFNIFESTDYPSEDGVLLSQYDNSVLYTDYVLSELMAKTQTMNGNLLFFADHGLANKNSSIPLKHDVRDNIALDSLHIPLITTGPNRHMLPDLKAYSLYHFSCLFSVWSGITAKQLNKDNLCTKALESRQIRYLDANLKLREATPHTEANPAHGK